MSDDMHEQLVKLTEERNGLVDTVASMSRTVAALRGELTKHRGESRDMPDAREVFEVWVRLLGKNKRTTFGPARQKAVLARLKEPALTEDGDRKADLLKAVEGMAAKRFVGSKGRQSGPGPGAKCHDDLALICRDETTVERFLAYVEEAVQEREAGVQADLQYRDGLMEKAKARAFVDHGRDLDDDRRVAWGSGGLDAVLRALHAKDCRVIDYPSDRTRFGATCPAHEDRSPSLSIRELGDGKVLLNCFAGCPTVDVITALGLEWTDLWPEQDRGPSLDPAHPRTAAQPQLGQEAA